MISLEEGLNLIEKHITGSLPVEGVELNQSLNRILAEDVFSDMDFPSFDKSAMDGYAIKKKDINRNLMVIEFIPAGKKAEKEVTSGTCAKIMTGAMVPKGADMVVMKEDVEVNGDKISINNSDSKVNILVKGEDVKQGDLILEKGLQINPVHIGMMASVGMTQPSVYKKPVISIISTGDELVAPNEKPAPPKIRNSNSSQLEALASSIGAEVINKGQVGDKLESIYESVRDAMEESDIVVITGGASVGDLDFTGAVFEKLQSEIHFTKLAIQPGKPVLFATAEGKYLFGLSGNPVSSYVQFQLLVRPLINKLTQNSNAITNYKMPISKDLSRKRAERQLFFPVRFNEKMEAEPLEYHGSAHLNSYAKADGMGSFPIGINELKKGSLIDVRPI